MAFDTRPSEARLKQILVRQDPAQWGNKYVPAILATREEAPSESRPKTIKAFMLDRNIHVLSGPEQELLLFGLYFPQMVNLHEQRMLSYLSCSHPLSNHPHCQHQAWPVSRGTLAIAEELAALKCHPTILVPDPDLEGERMRIPYPLIGDFLWYFKDDLGIYCVNWTIKGAAGDFTMKKKFDSPIPPNAKRAETDAWKAAMRHCIEELYYRELGIRTQRLTAQDYSADVARNLEVIYGWRNRPSTLTVEEQKKILSWLSMAQSAGISPNQMCAELAGTERFTRYEVKYVMYRAIWERQLRVDLFQPILFDFPLLPEKRDILTVYANWFRR